jgi:hypothetical protein
MSTYRVEHRNGERTDVVARTSDVHARQEELSQHAARLMREGKAGELVLVEESTGAEVARRTLLAGPAAEDGAAGDGADRARPGEDIP